MRMAVGVCLQLYHKAVELPRVVVQRIEVIEVQGFEVQVMEFQSVETQVVEMMVEVNVDEVLVVEREVEFLVVEKEVEFLVVLVWVREDVLVESGHFLVECLDFLRSERKHVHQFQTELCQVLMLLMSWVLEFGIWCGVF